MSDDSPDANARGLLAGLASRRSNGNETRAAKRWVAEASGAPDDATILVTELACSEPGCPPYEVMMAVLAADGTRRQRKFHVRLTELTREHVLDAWSEGEHAHHGEHAEAPHNQEQRRDKDC